MTGGLKTLAAGPNNTIITGLNAPNYPRSKQGVLGDFGVYQLGRLLYYPKLYTVNIQGTIGRDNEHGSRLLLARIFLNML